MRIRNVKNKTEIMNESCYLLKNYFNYCGKWKEVFKNSNPIYIEIGMGKGQFIIENALKYPNINFIGIEKFDSIVAKCLKKIPDGLDNLIILRANALDIDKIFDNEVDKIYLNFSDPWPKNRHSSRRLTSNVFLDKYKKILKGDSTIEMRTDNRELFQYSLVSLSMDGYILEEVSLDLHHDNMPLITTEYEDKFSDKGMPIYYLKGSNLSIYRK